MFSPIEPVHRLVDMVVEEVSLVDRAANKHRFLIVKRDEAMAEEENKQKVTKESTALTVAVSALDGLTRAVELLGQAGADKVDSRVAELAAQLRTTTEQMLARLTGAEEPVSETPEEKKKGTEEQEASFAQHIEATKQALSQLAELANKVEVPAPAPAPAAEPAPEPIPTEPPSDDAIAKLTQQFEVFSNLMKEQQQRLGRVEKNVGLPNSNPAPEQVSKTDTKEVSWPLDLNDFKDRESVDKSVSFHDP